MGRDETVRGAREGNGLCRRVGGEKEQLITMETRELRSGYSEGGRYRGGGEGFYLD